MLSGTLLMDGRKKSSILTKTLKTGIILYVDDKVKAALDR